MIFAYDRHGNLTSHKVESGKIINVKDYEEYIKKTKKNKDKRSAGRDLNFWQPAQ